ncbi:Sugar (and other) transporter [Geosmithia morbida]|uniref:Sugar (And other) transporter n=1 Tax=Geosmithia morbida TaxID=1094350 RepID=A0A9P5D739_9HYPO|nr:Sugar (and other) transporter [Geosmithia morbida]KAF4124144.1 Sugar (and other) transporter [Geosmithia morbida]
MGLNQIFKRPDKAATVETQREAPTFEKVIWYRDPGLRLLYWHCFVLCWSSATSGYDGMFFNSVQNFDSWVSFFDEPDGTRLGLLGASYQIASVVSIPVVPYIADRWGRKVSIVIGFIIMIVGAVLQGSAQEFGAFIGGRVLLGFGYPFTQLASPMLLAEIAHPQHRARMTTVYNCLWNGGAFIVAWVAFGTDFLGNDWSWRIPAILQGAPSFFQLLVIWWVPESPRYLIYHDRHEEALNMLAKYHANGDAGNPTVQFEYHEISETIKLEKAVSKSSSYLDFFRTKGNRYRLMILISLGFFSQWSGNAIVSNYSAKVYESVGVTHSTAKLGLSAGQMSMSCIVALFFATKVDQWGRRPIFLISTASMFVCLVFWTLCFALYEVYDMPGADTGVIFLIWLFSFAYAIAWSGLLIAYAVEILPYTLRAKGLMVVNLCVQAALALNNQANPVAFDYWAGETWKLYIIYVAWVLFELFFVFWKYVETKGPTLEELAKIIDGPDAPVASINIGKLEYEHDEKKAEIEVHHDGEHKTFA